MPRHSRRDSPGAPPRRRRPLPALALAVLALVPAAGAQEAFRIIVHPANPGIQIKRESLQAIYLRQGARWPDGKAVKAVDQSTRSPVRAAFCQEALGMDVMAVQNLWFQALRAGKGTPPPVKGSDADVVAFVRGDPTAIGYVSAGATLDEGVKVLKLVE